MHLKYQITILIFSWLILGCSPLATAYEFTDNSYYYQYEGTIDPDNFLILPQNFTDFFIKDHVLNVLFKIFYIQNVTIYWINHSGYLEFIANNQTEDISPSNIEWQKYLSSNFSVLVINFKIKTFYMAIINPNLFPQDCLIQLWARFYYHNRPASLSWYIVVALISINLVFISITIYLYRKKKLDSIREENI